MGIVQRQSAWNLVSGYLGVLLGALNALVLFPLAFPNPENMGGVRWLISASLLLGAVAHLGWPQTMVTFFPKIPARFPSSTLRFGLLLSAGVLAIMALALYHPLGKAALVDLSGGVERDELAFLLPMAVAYVGFELFASRLIHAQQVILPYWLKDAGRKGWLTLLLLVRMSGFLRDQTPLFDRLASRLCAAGRMDLVPQSTASCSVGDRFVRRLAAPSDVKVFGGHARDGRGPNGLWAIGYSDGRGLVGLGRGRALQHRLQFWHCGVHADEGDERLVAPHHRQVGCDGILGGSSNSR